MTDRKKPGVAFWATVVLVVVLVGYPLSFGPACWITSRRGTTPEVIYKIYRPVIYNWGRAPRSGSLWKAVHWYAQLGAPGGSIMWPYVGRDGKTRWAWVNLESS